MPKYIDVDSAAYDYGTLADWLISSVGPEPPVWTEPHIEELLEDFYVVPKSTPPSDVVEVRHGRWEFTEDVDMPWCTKAVCTSCGVTIADNIDLSQSFGRKRFIRYNRYCPDCGAKMDGGKDDV